MKLGERLKDLRQYYNLTQEELADRCELTKGYISQLENDLTSPSISTLVDILSALGTTLSEFFSKEDENEKVVFGKEDYIVKETDDYTLEWLIPNAQKNAMESTLLTLNAGGETDEDFPHEGEEFGYVLEGEIVIFVGKKKLVCKKGESFYYSADKTHKIANEKTKRAKFIWISSPPNF